MFSITHCKSVEAGDMSHMSNCCIFDCWVYSACQGSVQLSHAQLVMTFATKKIAAGHEPGMGQTALSPPGYPSLRPYSTAALVHSLSNHACSLAVAITIILPSLQQLSLTDTPLLFQEPLSPPPPAPMTTSPLQLPPGCILPNMQF